MLRRLRNWVGCSCSMLLALSLLGCSPASDDGTRATQTAPHDHEGQDHGSHSHGARDHDSTQPTDFPAAVAAVRQHYEAIRDAFQANEVDKAHGPLHTVGQRIEALPELAAKAKLGDQESATVKAAAAAMFEAYGEIDDALHTGKQADYAAAADKLDKGMADLQAVVDGMTKNAEE